MAGDAIEESFPADAPRTRILDKTTDLSSTYQAEVTRGQLSFDGVCGFHTYFRHDAGLDYALHTALHAAFDDVLTDIYLAPCIFGGDDGTVGPAGAARELEHQLATTLGLAPGSRFVRRLTAAFEATLRRYQSKLEMTPEASI